MNEPLDRPGLPHLSAEQIAPIEARTSGWPESWRDIARSIYVTLLTGTKAIEPADAADLGAELMLGIAADMGGTQPYINQGSELHRNSMVTRVVELLSRWHQDYARVAQEVGLSDRHVRRIEARWLRVERAKRQGSLDLGDTENH